MADAVHKPPTFTVNRFSLPDEETVSTLIFDDKESKERIGQIKPLTSASQTRGTRALRGKRLESNFESIR